MHFLGHRPQLIPHRRALSVLPLLYPPPANFIPSGRQASRALDPIVPVFQEWGDTVDCMETPPRPLVGGWVCNAPLIPPGRCDKHTCTSAQSLFFGFDSEPSAPGGTPPQNATKCVHAADPDGGLWVTAQAYPATLVSDGGSVHLTRLLCTRLFGDLPTPWSPPIFSTPDGWIPHSQSRCSGKRQLRFRPSGKMRNIRTVKTVMIGNSVHFSPFSSICLLVHQIFSGPPPVIPPSIPPPPPCCPAFSLHFPPPPPGKPFPPIFPFSPNFQSHSGIWEFRIRVHRRLDLVPSASEG